jgi:hypothetical protein
VLLLPPAIFAFVNGLDARNYAVLAVLGAVAVGVAGAHLAQLGGRQPVVVAALPLVALVALAGLGQVEAGRAYEPPLPAQLAAWLGERVGPGDKVATTFRFRALVAVELYGRTVVEELRPARVRPDDDPADYVWMGLRDRQLFGYRRGAWVRTLGDPSIRYLAIVEPHFFAPLELEPFLASADAESTGLQIVERLEPDGPTATILSVDPSRVADGTAAIPLHVTPEALGAWLSLAGPDAAVKMASARPVVTGEGSQPDVGCFRPAGQPFPEGWLHLEPCA